MRGLVIPTPIEVGQSQADGWTRDYAETLTYASATTFTVAGDQTVKFQRGTRIKLTQTTVKYFVVTGASFASSVTTVTITGGTDYTLANAIISDPYYSYEASPQGYPSYFNYTPTFTGFSANPTNIAARFSVVGGICHVKYYSDPGTSNATTFTVTLPIASLIGGGYFPVKGYNNTAHSPDPALMVMGNGSVTVDLYKDMAFAAWTASGSKGVHFNVFYEIA
jgi:hypothetical protein